MAISVEQLAEVFVEMADTLVDDFDIIEFLQGVTRHTSELAPATAAGLLLADHRGRLQLMAASDEQARMVELFQVQAVEGPCQDCYRPGSPVVNADLSTAGGRWPQFAPRAVEAGFRSVHAFPLRLRRQVIGALNLFGSEPTHMEAADVRVVQAWPTSPPSACSSNAPSSTPSWSRNSCRPRWTVASSSNRPRAPSPRSTAAVPTRPSSCCAAGAETTTDGSPRLPRPSPPTRPVSRTSPPRAPNPEPGPPPAADRTQARAEWKNQSWPSGSRTPYSRTP